MMDKGKRQQRQREEDAVFNRMLLWLAGAVAAEVLVFLLRQVYVNMVLSPAVANALGIFFSVFQYAGLVLTAAAVVWLVLRVRSGRPALAPVIAAVVLGFLWLAALLCYQFFDSGVRMLMVIPPAAGVLILIWFLYQRTFFVSAVITGGGLAAVWLFREYYMGHPRALLVCFAAGWIALGAVMLLSLKLKSSGGKLGALRVMPEDAPYPAIWLTCAVNAVTLALSLLLGVTAAFYLLFVLVGWLFILAVYFTVKLM